MAMNRSPIFLALEVLFVCADALHPSKQIFSHVGMISCLAGLNQN